MTLGKLLEIIQAIEDVLDGLTAEEAMEEVRAFREREQEDEDKPWAKPT